MSEYYRFTVAQASDDTWLADCVSDKISFTEDTREKLLAAMKKKFGKQAKCSKRKNKWILNLNPKNIAEKQI
uniref:Uncharacterized protein n=1 Tax=Marseillevirus LCMAC201 TaxID=2506605 RepID=A0A481YVN9_9VIRU|nr:MAG: hypothetical protein LCMAC201_02730 [Marseillevirus LCMAC201]